MATALELREAYADLNTLAARELGPIWLALRQGADVADALHDVLPALIDKYGFAAAAVAADWYDDLRESLGIGGLFAAIPADVPDTGAHALIGWALNEATSDASFQALLEGGLQKRIVNFGRFTVIQSSVGDPKAEGWQRLGVGSSCPFCDLLNSRGAVYTKTSVDFGAHDNDDCIAVPAFGGQPIPVKPYKPSTRQSSKADRDRARDWIAAHL